MWVQNAVVTARLLLVKQVTFGEVCYGDLELLGAVVARRPRAAIRQLVARVQRRPKSRAPDGGAATDTPPGPLLGGGD